jgi:hypothetical protein
MNLFNVKSAKNGLLFVGFNQDASKIFGYLLIFIYENHLDCFACGIENGFRIYNTDPLRQTQRQGTTKLHCLYRHIFLISVQILVRVELELDKLKCYFVVIMLHLLVVEKTPNILHQKVNHHNAQR